MASSPLDVVGPLAVIAALILANGVFVAAEFVIIGVPKAAIDRRAAAGDKVARRIAAILGDPRRQDRFIATAQLGITLASLALGMYGEHVVAEWFYHGLAALGAASWGAAHGLAATLAIATMTYFHIVVGELVPKSLALQHAERTADWITPPMLAFQQATLPLVIALDAAGTGALRLVGAARRSGSTQHLSGEELQYLVRESQEGGLFRPAAGDMLIDLFEFGDRTATQAMVPRMAVRGIPLGASPEALREILRTAPHTRYPVFRGDLDHVEGAVHVKDLARLIDAGKAVGTPDVRPIPRVPGTSTLDTVLRAMRQARVQVALVMDEHGGTAGIVTVDDLFTEVTGEIDDGRLTPPAITTGADGRLRAAGTVRLAELGDLLGMPLEDPRVDTVSGLILLRLDRPPVIGDVVVHRRVAFEVDAVAHHGVESCLVSVLADESTPSP